MKLKFVCSVCEAEAAQWAGQCNYCLSWNSLINSHEFSKKKDKETYHPLSKKINEIEVDESVKVSTGSKEMDRILGGGIEKNALIIVGGEPGAGKSTLLMGLLGRISSRNEQVLYVTSEESLAQVAKRAKRLNILSNNFNLLNENSVQNILKEINQLKPAYVVIDSMQTTHTEEVPSMPGSPGQVREIVFQLMKCSKDNGPVIIIIGHVNKEGGLAGPKYVEHMVDIALHFEFDKKESKRHLICTKNRYGRTGLRGTFIIDELGIRDY